MDAKQHRFFVSLLKPGNSVLDVGCGSGDKSLYMTKKGLKVTGLDFSEEMIKIAKKQVPGGNFLAMDVEQIDPLKEKYDGIFVRAVLLHFSKKKIPGILQKLIAHLNRGGFLYIAVKEKREGEKDEEIVSENDYGADIDRFFSYFTVPELERLLTDAGLKICFSEVTAVKGGTRRWIQMIAHKE